MNEPKIFITADLHLGHANIIRYCGRPYRDVNEMNEDLIRRWNSVVSDNDRVFFLGDFALGDIEKKYCSFVYLLEYERSIVLP